MLRYDYSVFAVCESIISHYSGTSDGLTDEKLQIQLAWLEWRISGDVWLASKPDFVSVEKAIREMAKQTIKLAQNKEQEKICQSTFGEAKCDQLKEHTGPHTDNKLLCAWLNPEFVGKMPEITTKLQLFFLGKKNDR